MEGFEVTGEKERDLISLDSLSRGEMSEIVDRAGEHRRAAPSRAPGSALSGLVGQLFLEPSTRTRVSFFSAARRLSLDVVDIDRANSSFTKGESLIDGARTLVAQGIAVLVLRQREEGMTARVSAAVDVPVINAGEGRSSHPTQGLLDLMTLLDEWGDLTGKRIGIVGDIVHSRVARSDIAAFTAFGAEMVLIGPENLLPSQQEFPGVSLVGGFDEVLPTLDAVVMLRVQHERLGDGECPDLDEFVAAYRLDSKRLKAAGTDLLVLHPGPMNRGIEITDEVADGEHSRVLAQVANGVHLRMAILERALTEPA